MPTVNGWKLPRNQNGPCAQTRPCRSFSGTQSMDRDSIPPTTAADRSLVTSLMKPPDLWRRPPPGYPSRTDAPLPDRYVSLEVPG